MQNILGEDIRFINKYEFTLHHSDVSHIVKLLVKDKNPDLEFTEDDIQCFVVTCDFSEDPTTAVASYSSSTLQTHILLDETLVDVNADELIAKEVAHIIQRYLYKDVQVSTDFVLLSKKEDTFYTDQAVSLVPELKEIFTNILTEQNIVLSGHTYIDDDLASLQILDLDTELDFNSDVEDECETDAELLKKTYESYSDFDAVVYSPEDDLDEFDEAQRKSKLKKDSVKTKGTKNSKESKEQKKVEQESPEIPSISGTLTQKDIEASLKRRNRFYI